MGQRGFTLLEMMLAVTLFSVSTLGSMELLNRAEAAAADGENLVIATYLAQARLEELRNALYANLANEAKASIASPSGFTRFSREVTVTTPYTDLERVLVTVYWNAPGGETNVKLWTHRSNR